MQKTLPTIARLITTGVALTVMLPLAFAAQSFKDVSPKSPAYAAVEFLKSQNILQGYADGTFRPANKVKRAEAMKILVSTKLTQSEVSAFTTTGFNDVPAGSWFLPYVEAGVKKLGIIDGPPKVAAFRPDAPVTRAEFLKMLFKSQNVSMDGVADITYTLANDTSAKDWYYPYMRYAVAASLLQIDKSGNLNPGGTVTREDVAQYLYLLAMYNSGKRTQALLGEVETEITNVYKSISEKDNVQAARASSRAFLAARGAYLSRPTDNVARGALKITEALHTMTDGYTAGSMQNFDESIAKSKEAWNLAEKAKSFTPKVNSYATAIQQLCKTMADTARKGAAK